MSKLVHQYQCGVGQRSNHRFFQIVCDLYLPMITSNCKGFRLQNLPNAWEAEIYFKRFNVFPKLLRTMNLSRNICLARQIDNNELKLLTRRRK
jgi:hypothetical protein